MSNLNTVPREFYTFGPVNPATHYHVNRVGVKAEIQQKIDKGRYFTLNAARQSGKTTLFREVIARLQNEKTHFGILLSFEAFRSYSWADFYEQLGLRLAEQTVPALQSLSDLDTLPSPLSLRHHGDFIRWLEQVRQIMNRPGILIIDEFDAIGSELAEPILAAFRDMYLNRHLPTVSALQSIMLVGVRNIPALLGGSQSPFNIADQYEVPYFTETETVDLLRQHTTETGQPFDDEVVEAIYRECEGQPFLANRLGQILTQELVQNRSTPITLNHLDQALTDLLTENNTHFASITSKAIPHRSTLLPIIFYDERRSNFRNEIIQELIMYGILRQVPENTIRVARIANPIYRKLLILTFTPPQGTLDYNGSFRHRYLIDGVLDLESLLDGFTEMMREHGITLLRSKKTDRPLEIGGQYLLLSYLTAALDSIGGHVTLEAVNSAGEMDLLIFYRQARFIIETKLWYGLRHFEKGQAQLANYLLAAHQEKGYIVLFSEQALDETLQPSPFEVTAHGKRMRVYVIVIGR